MILGGLLLIAALFVVGGIGQAIWNKHHPKNDQYYQGALDFTNRESDEDYEERRRRRRRRRVEPWNGF